MKVRRAAGNVWKYDNKDHGVRCPRATKILVSYEMFTADMHSFIFIIIYIG